MHANLQMPSDNWITLKSLRLPANHWIAHRNGRRASIFHPITEIMQNYSPTLASTPYTSQLPPTLTTITYCNVCKPTNMFSAKNLWYGLLTRRLPSVALPNKKLVFDGSYVDTFLPKTITAKQWIREGRIGKVKLMQATIGWKADPVYNKRLFDPALGGGSLYDLGIYPLEVLPYLVDEKYWIWRLLLQDILQV